jgi:hypothetical protein
MLEIMRHYMVYMNVLQRCDGNPNVLAWDSHIYIHYVDILVGGGGHTISTTWGKFCSLSKISCFPIFLSFHVNAYL